MSASFSFAFSISAGIVQKLLKTTGNKKKKQKVNYIESKIPEALIYNEISHEEFMTIINQEKNSRTKRKH